MRDLHLFPSGIAAQGFSKYGWRVLLFAILICFTAPMTAFGQSTFGSILGTVKDASGALIPGASVTLTNIGTAAARTTTTNASGDYSFLNLNAGKYTISIVASGFEKTEFADLDLQ